jgi:hypothetical protein
MLSQSELENLVERLAESIDAAAEPQLFLTKLALLLAERVGDAATVMQALEIAQRSMTEDD